jgi:membrane associated rhomboid family serine protease
LFPLRDVIPARSVPFVTVGLIAVNALCWAYELSLTGEALRAFAREWGVVPAGFDPLTVIPAMFLHGGWLHLISNMWFLWIFGDNVEDRMGHRRFLLFYLLCGAGAAVGQVLVEPRSLLPTIGASGAVSGVMGAYLVLYPRSRVLTLIPLIVVWDIVEVPAIVLLGLWFLLQAINALSETRVEVPSGGIAFAAHVAGFVFGILGVFLFRTRRRPRW